MVAAAAALALLWRPQVRDLPVPKQDAPAILIYLKPTFYYPPRSLDLFIAIWKDGTMIWRDPQDTVTSHGDTITTEPEYYKGQVSAAFVIDLLNKAKKSSAFNSGDWSLCDVDSDETIAVVRNDKDVACLKYSEHDWRIAESSFFGYAYRSQFRLWNLLRDGSKKLIPTHGEKIDRPSSELIDQWAWNSD